MQTQHQVLKRGGLYWDRELVPRATFDARCAALGAALAASGDDAWLVYGDAQGYGDLAHFSHFLPRLRSALALVMKDRPPALLANVGLRDIPASKTLTWIDDVRPFTRLPAETVKLVRERGLAGAKIGVVGLAGALPVVEWDAIRSELPDVTWTERGAEFAALRVRQDAAALAAVAGAAAVVREGLHAASSALHAGTTVRRALARIDRAMRMRAAEDIRILVASGPQCAIALRPADDRVLERGDAVMLFLSVEVQRHWAEAAQTYVLGTPSAALQAVAGTAFAAVGAMAAAVAPNAAASAIARAGETAIGDAALASSARAYGLGHGIGLDHDEAPALDRDGTGRVSDSTALALHAVLHGTDAGAAAGTTIVLRDGRVEPLIDTEALIELPGDEKGDAR